MELTPFGYQITKNEQGLISLTDIYKAAGSPDNKQLKDWLRLNTTSQFIETAARFLKVGKSHLIKISRGKGGGTWGHDQIALEYAQYLDPKLAVAVNQIFFERIEEEKDPQKAIDRARATWKRQGKSDKWISMRLTSIEERKSFTYTLSSHGVTGPGYKDCTNAIYKPLWGGGAELIRAKKNIPEGSNCRDFMTEIELAGVRLAELLAEENIEKHNAKGNDEVKFYCEKASKSIANAIIVNAPKKICPVCK